jgi:DAK2 domain fusion protein YloV
MDEGRVPIGSHASCDGPGLRSLVAAGLELLRRRARLIDNFNVFPVPDGDTGTNLLLTLRAAVDALDARQDESTTHFTVGEAAGALAHGALMGARGNSGVILSQFLAGLARGLQGLDLIDGPALARALEQAAAAARAAVARPAEGTILTVAADAARAATDAATRSTDVGAVLVAAASEARASVRRTRDLLPILREAGVDDAGGMGLATILEGIDRSWRGEALPAEESVDLPAPAATRLEPAAYGYCTEFLVSAADARRLDASKIQTLLEPLGNSLLVVGEPGLVRVHLHTFSPGQAIDLVLAHGEVSQVKIENMQQQNRRLRGCDAQAAPTVACGLVAVCSGDGFRAVLESLGVAAIVPGGATMNPSAEEILRGIAHVSARECVVLPNSPNVQLAANQATQLAARPVAVAGTRDQAQGVAAALAFSPTASAEANLAAMDRAIDELRTASIAIAARDSRFSGREIARGATLGLIDDEIAVVAHDVAAAVLETLSRIGADRAEVITLYRGADVDARAATSIAERVRGAYPSAQVDLVVGGQPHYPFILACE